MTANVCAEDLEKELILMEQELIFKRNLLTECRERLNSEISEHAQTKSTVQKYINENRELQIQLNACVTGIQKLEEENKKNQDDLVKLQVQFNAYLTERQQVLDNCYQSEKDNIALKTEVDELKEKLKENLMFINNFKEKHSKTQALVNETIEKQEVLNKEQARLQKICKEGLQFAEKVSEEAKFHIKYVQEAKISQTKIENEIIRLMAVVTELKAERERIKNDQLPTGNPNYLETWITRQRELQIKNEELQEINQRLVEELNFTKEQVEILIKNY